MARLFAHHAKIIDRFDQASAKEMVPDPIDHDPGGQRVVPAGQPAGQFQTPAVGRIDRWDPGNLQRAEETARHQVARLVKIAPDRNFRVRRLGPIAHTHGVGMAEEAVVSLVHPRLPVTGQASALSFST